MASVKVLYSDLEDAFLAADYETQHFWLDTQTGRVLAYSSEAAEALEDGDLSNLPDWMQDDLAAAREVLRYFGEIPDESSQRALTSDQGSVAHPLAVTGSIEADADRKDASTEQTVQNIACAADEGIGTSLSEASAEENEHESNTNESNRYVGIEPVPSNEAFQFMSDFVDEVANPRIRDVLQHAVRGNRPFRRFNDVINRFPREREQWFAYESLRRCDYIEEWARDVGVEIDFSGDVS